jgi:demethylmenaquinone methyltransferase/2-methoxy-6-polyprenyl-1,4-benzoquinol methylase
MADQAIWKTEGEQKRTRVQGMFAEIAPTYDAMNSVMSFRLHHRWRAAAVAKLELQPGDRALDVCCGTGDFLLPLQRAVGPSGFVAGTDFCLPMLAVVPKKVQRPAVALGDACRLPYASGVFDGVTVGWGIRNVSSVDAAHREIARVLRPGGRFVSLDMARPRNPVLRILSKFVFHTVVPLLGSLLGKTKAYTYLPKSTERFASREELAESMRQAGFRDVGFRDFFFGNICMHWGTKA